MVKPRTHAPALQGEPRGSERVNTRSGLTRASNATTTSGGSRVVACDEIQALRFACAAASLSTTRRDTLASYHRRSEVNAL